LVLGCVLADCHIDAAFALSQEQMLEAKTCRNDVAAEE
jgi:hypothetical protein